MKVDLLYGKKTRFTLEYIRRMWMNETLQVTKRMWHHAIWLQAKKEYFPSNVHRFPSGRENLHFCKVFPCIMRKCVFFWRSVTEELRKPYYFWKTDDDTKSKYFLKGKVWFCFSINFKQAEWTISFFYSEWLLTFFLSAESEKYCLNFFVIEFFVYSIFPFFFEIEMFLNADRTQVQRWNRNRI